MVVELRDRIDSNNAKEVEDAILSQLEGYTGDDLELNAAKLEYISSAGLRIVLHLKKQYKNLKITGVSSEVYEILDMTGFTEMMDVEKAYKTVSIEGCEQIGQGANGSIYRIDQDNVVKVYNNPDALDDIKHEREVARIALVLGIPTAISYDVVKVGDSYGSVFELLNARSFSKILANEPDKMDWCVEEYVKMLKKIHSTLVPKGKLPDARDTAINWAKYTAEHLPKETGDKLIKLIEALPVDDHMIHGDYHIKNLELTNDEVLLIDMDTLSVGHPIIELASIYNAMVGYYEVDKDYIVKFLGISYETGVTFWKKFLVAYLGTEDEKRLKEIEDKAKVIGYTRMIRRSLRRKLNETETGKAEIELWTKELIDLVDRIDCLEFTCNEMVIEANTDNLPLVQAFVEDKLSAIDCPPKASMQIEVAVEEIFVNIANYAYRPETGIAVVRVEISDEPVTVSITFIDHGRPYDPLAKEDPDITLSADEREIGGLGIFMTKKTMDDVNYEYKDGSNILTLKKNI